MWHRHGAMTRRAVGAGLGGAAGAAALAGAACGAG